MNWRLRRVAGVIPGQVQGQEEANVPVSSLYIVGFMLYTNVLFLNALKLE